MTKEELWNKFNKEESIINHFLYLFERWEDEGQYEDIGDYLESVKSVVPEAFRIEENPFSISFLCSDGVFRIYCEFSGDLIKVSGEF